jgi:hypothetical protein
LPRARSLQVVDETASKGVLAKRPRTQPPPQLAGQVRPRARARRVPLALAGGTPRSHTDALAAPCQEGHALHRLNANLDNLDCTPVEGEGARKAPAASCQPEAQLHSPGRSADDPAKHIQRAPASFRRSPYSGVNALLKELHYQRIVRHGLEPLQPGCR